MNIKKKISFLIQLQEVDAEIGRIDQVLDSVTERVDALDKALSLEKAAASKKINAFETLKKDAAVFEEEIQVCDTRLDKDNAHLRKCTSHKEYQVIQREIDETKKRKSETEDRLIELMADIEAAETEYNQLVVDIAVREKDAAAERDSIFSENTHERDEREKYLTTRSKIAENLDPLTFERYNKILDQTNGPAIVHIDNGMCYGCFMNIPPQYCIEVQRGEDVHYCPHCHRMVYFREDEPAVSA